MATKRSGGESIMKKKIISLLLAATMAMSLAACDSTDSAETAESVKGETTEVSKTEETEKAEETPEELPTLRIALPTWVGYGSLYVAQEKGFFEEAGVNVELSIVEGLAERKQALISGNLEGLATAVDVFVNLEDNDIDMDIVWLLDRSNGADGIVATSDITTPADLAGKTIATEIGTTEHFFLLKVLEQYGLTEDDIELVPMTIGEAGTAFVAGKVDVAVTYDPYLASGIEAGGVGFTTADYDINLMDAVGFSDEVIESDPEAVQAFVNGLAKAVDYINENPEECIPIEAAGLKLEEADVASTLEKLECYDLAGNTEMMGSTDGQLYEDVKNIAIFYVEQELNSEEISADSIINSTFIRNAAE